MITLDEGLLRRAEERAAARERTPDDVISDGLRLLLAERPGSHREITPPTFGGSGLLPGVNLEDKDALKDDDPAVD